MTSQSPARRHTLLVSYRIVAGSYTGDAVFRGLVLGEREHTFRLPRPRRSTEWIGDSITAGYTATNVSLSAFPWLVSENLGVTHTQIALSGSCLRELTAAESIRGIRCFGLRNDVGHGVAAADVLTAYEHLLRIVRERNPHAVILALRIFKGWWAAETQQAVLNRGYLQPFVAAALDRCRDA